MLDGIRSKKIELFDLTFASERIEQDLFGSSKKFKEVLRSRQRDVRAQVCLTQLES